MAFAPVAGTYAVVQAIAWHSTFATMAERIMWRLSVLYLSVVFVICLVYGLYSALRESLRGKQADCWRVREGCIVSRSR